MCTTAGRDRRGSQFSGVHGRSASFHKLIKLRPWVNKLSVFNLDESSCQCVCQTMTDSELKLAEAGTAAGGRWRRHDPESIRTGSELRAWRCDSGMRAGSEPAARGRERRSCCLGSAWVVPSKLMWHYGTLQRLRSGAEMVATKGKPSRASDTSLGNARYSPSCRTKGSHALSLAAAAARAERGERRRPLPLPRSLRRKARQATLPTGHSELLVPGAVACPHL